MRIQQNSATVPINKHNKDNPPNNPPISATFTGSGAPIADDCETSFCVKVVLPIGNMLTVDEVDSLPTPEGRVSVAEIVDILGDSAVVVPDVTGVFGDVVVCEDTLRLVDVVAMGVMLSMNGVGNGEALGLGDTVRGCGVVRDVSRVVVVVVLVVGGCVQSFCTQMQSGGTLVHCKHCSEPWPCKEQARAD